MKHRRRHRRLAGCALVVAALTACSSAPLPASLQGPDGPTPANGSPTPVVDPPPGQVVTTSAPGGGSTTGAAPGTTGSLSGSGTTGPVGQGAGTSGTGGSSVG